MSVEELQRRLAPSKAASPGISEREGNSSTRRRFLRPAFFMSYIYAIFISAKFSARGPERHCIDPRRETPKFRR